MDHNRIESYAHHLDEKTVCKVASLQDAGIDARAPAHEKRACGFPRIKRYRHFQSKDICSTKWKNSEKRLGSCKTSRHFRYRAIPSSRNDNAPLISCHARKFFRIAACAGFQQLKLNAKTVENIKC